jgi:trigger factor
LALIEGCKHSVDITIPMEEVVAETEKVVESVRQKAHLQGFRPGKAPSSLIRQRYQSDIRQQVLDNLVPRFIQKEAERKNVEIVSRAEISDVHFHAGEPVRFKAQFEVAPTFDLREVRGLTVGYAEPQVTDADVEHRLENMREQKAEYVNLDPRPAVDGDHVLVAMESISGIEGPALRQDDLSVEIGHADTFPALSDALRGAVPGDIREAEVSYPENYAAERLTGKTVRWRIEVKALRLKELPELNDEFAKDLGDFQSLDELKEELRKSTFREREYVAQTTAKNELVDKMVDMHDFPVPEVYVDQQTQANLERQLTTLSSQGVDVSKLKLDWEKVRSAQRDKAVRDVKASLLLGKLADRESVFASNEEVDREVQRIARQEREPVAATRMRLQKDGSLNRIAARIRTEKTLSFLFENARKEAPKEAAATVGQEAEAQE